MIGSGSMMAQLLAHLWGDYLLQSDWMALNKRKDSWVCMAHASLYALCFLPVVPWHWHSYPFGILLAIQLSHFLIDRFGLARYIVWAKNFIAPREAPYPRYWPWAQCSDTGYDKNRPAWLTVWLLIIADNTLHLTCNYLALRYL